MSTKDSLKLAIFDLDGTLTDSLNSILVGCDFLAASAKKLFGAQDYRRTLERIEYALANDVHNPDMHEVVLPGDHPSIPSVAAEYRALRRENTTLVPGAGDLLTTLVRSGVACAIWTNKRANHVPRHLAELGLGPDLISAAYAKDVDVEFAAIDIPIYTVPVDARKPNKATLREIVAFHGASEWQTVLVGNNVRNDGGSTIGTNVAFVHAELGIPRAETRARLAAYGALSKDVATPKNRYQDYSSHVPQKSSFERPGLELIRRWIADASHQLAL